MSLDWNTSKCPGNGVTAGWISIPERDQEKSCIHPDTARLAWGAFIGFHIGSITPKTIDEIIWRIEFLKLINQSWMSDKKFPSRKAVDAHLDFTTNCPTLTRKQWLGRISKSLSNQVTENIKRSYEEEDEA